MARISICCCSWIHHQPSMCLDSPAAETESDSATDGDVAGSTEMDCDCCWSGVYPFHYLTD